VIQLGEQFADGGVEFFQRKELMMAQRRHDPALGDLHGAFGFGFVSRLVRPRGHDAEAAVQREVVVSRIQIRIVAVRLGHTGLGVVGNHQRRNAAKVLEGMHVRAQPRLHLLIARGLGPGVGTGAERGHEQGSLPGQAGVPVVHRNRRAGPIHKHLLAGFVLLPQHHIEFRAPTLVQLAEARVAVALRVPLPVFLPQQLQRHVLAAAQLLVDRGEVGRRTRRVLLRMLGSRRGNSAASTRASSQSSGSGQVTPAASARFRYL
jgi:hypothetical protein